ncbi:MAG: transcriptional regulator [Flavobacteriales bacterium]|nr:transcriptional regulator [Flavobacteriales bacterium]|tara:strand:+ start:1356 stop:1745 length:390 start_codon:yes stop_codon:yes gene_type:complete
MKKLKKKIDICFEKTDTGYSAYADDLGVYTTADSMDLLTTNIIEALNFYYEDQGYYVDHDNLTLKLDIPQFFNHYKVLNAKYLARRIGMNPVLLSQYVTGKKIPSQKQSLKIVSGIHSIGMELAGLKLK